jgi:hypothetical protein
MVEFVLVLIPVLLLALGIINFGYLFGQKLALNQAVREGARMAVVPGTDNGASVDTTDPEIRDLVRGSTGSLLNPNQVTVVVKDQATLSTITDGCKGLAVGEQLRVEASYPARLLIVMPIPFPSTFTLQSNAVFRCEW